MKKMQIQVYSCTNDELLPVIQKWCDDAQKALNDLGLHREIIRKISNLNIVTDRDKINAIRNLLEG